MDITNDPSIFPSFGLALVLLENEIWPAMFESIGRYTGKATPTGNFCMLINAFDRISDLC